MDIFLSSTLDDLREERAALLPFLAEHGRVVESYRTEESEWREQALVDLAICDAAIFVVGLRYGFIPPGHRKSLTQLEYEAAISHGVRVLVFLKDKTAIKEGHKDRMSESVVVFRAKLKDTSTVVRFKTVTELRDGVLKALAHLRHDQRAQTLPNTSRRGVFLCYRRDDTADATGRLRDTLAKEYGPRRVFMDIYSIPPAVNFVAHIDTQLRECGAVLVVIGRSWTTLTDARGLRRLDDPTDHVRIEIATALKQGTAIIPILVQHAAMPLPSELPEDIQALALYNAVKLPTDFWEAGVEKLIKELDRVMKG